MTAMQSDGNEMWQMCPPLTIPEDSYVGVCNDSYFLSLHQGVPAQNKVKCNVSGVSNWLPFSHSNSVIWVQSKVKSPLCKVMRFPWLRSSITVVAVLCKNLKVDICMWVCVFVCFYAHMHPPRTLYCLGLSPAISPPSSALSWQIAWISAACLRNNTSHQVDRGAQRSQLLFLALWDVYIQSSRSLSQQWSCIQWGFGEGVGGRWDVSAPLGNKGHLFNLRCGGSLQPECVVIQNVV